VLSYWLEGVKIPIFCACQVNKFTYIFGLMQLMVILIKLVTFKQD